MYAVIKNGKLVDVLERPRRFSGALIIKVKDKNDLIGYQKYDSQKIKSHKKANSFKSQWDFSNLPLGKVKIIKRFIERSNYDGLDAIRVKYQLASRCVSCNYSHENWLLNSFKIWLKTI